MLISNKVFNTYRFGNFHQCNITRICYSISNCLCSMSGSKMTTDIPVSYMQISSTHIVFIPFNCSCIQTCCHCKWFDRRAWFKCITNAKITPQFIHCLKLLILCFCIPVFRRINSRQISWLI